MNPSLPTNAFTLRMAHARKSTTHKSATATSQCDLRNVRNQESRMTAVTNGNDVCPVIDEYDVSSIVVVHHISVLSRILHL
jgi:hypothetical protein